MATYMINILERSIQTVFLEEKFLTPSYSPQFRRPQPQLSRLTDEPH
jgi:hypothetical protein